MSINHHQVVSHDVMHALVEDGASNDLSRCLTQNTDYIVCATLINFEPMLLAGVDWFEQSFRQLSKRVCVDWQFKEGEFIKPKQTIANISGSLSSLLGAERVALNFLQLISGVSTATQTYIEKVRQFSPHIQVLDTRKTIPNLRYAQKYATRLGGAKNHRFGLHEQLMIKDNHIVAAGGIQKVAQLAFDHYPKQAFIIEVDSLEQINTLIKHQLLPAHLLLDNFTPQMIKQAVGICAGQCYLEVSGNIKLSNLGDYLIEGIDYISVGGITKHVKSIDLSLSIENTA